MKNVITEVIYAQGHKNVLSTHKTTFEITKENFLSRYGDCIIAVGATKGARDLNQKFQKAAKKEGAKITIIVQAGEVIEVINAMGNPHLLFSHSTDLVVRKSDYVCDRTIAVQADKAACDLSKKLVKNLRDSCQKVTITLSVEC